MRPFLCSTSMIRCAYGAVRACGVARITMPGRTELTEIGRVITASPGANAGRIDPVSTLDAVMCKSNRANASTRAVATKTIAEIHCTALGTRNARPTDRPVVAVIADMDELSGHRTVPLTMQAAQFALSRAAHCDLARCD